MNIFCTIYYTAQFHYCFCFFRGNRKTWTN